MVISIVDLNLHIPYNVPDLHATSPLLYINGDVKYARVGRSDPGEVARIGIDKQGVAGRGQSIAFNGPAIQLGTDGQLVGDTVSIRIIGSRIVNEDLTVGSPVNGGI